MMMHVHVHVHVRVVDFLLLFFTSLSMFDKETVGVVTTVGVVRHEETGSGGKFCIGGDSVSPSSLFGKEHSSIRKSGVTPSPPPPPPLSAEEGGGRGGSGTSLRSVTSGKDSFTRDSPVEPLEDSETPLDSVAV